MNFNKYSCPMIIVYVVIAIIVLLLIINYIITNRIYALDGFHENMANVLNTSDDNPTHASLPAGLNNADTVRGIKRDKDTLVLYYTDWCPHSLALKPIWEKFAKINRSNIRMIALDCQQNRSMCSDQPNVKGFPTVILHKKNGDDVIFDGNRTVLGLSNFVTNNSN